MGLMPPSPRKKPDPVPGWHVSDEVENADIDRPDGTASTSSAASGDFTDASRGDRLQKVMAAAGVGSRRACEHLIEEGEVAVNGFPVTTLPAWVHPVTDHITVRGKAVKSSEPYVHIMLFKPRGYVCTNDDPDGRKLAIDLIKHPSKARLYSVGRLDLDSSGLLLLTNDGEFANRLTHPRYEMHKLYEVTVRGAIDDLAVRKLARGLFLHDRRATRGSRTAESRLKVLKRDRERTRLIMELQEGRNRQIRRMMLRIGHPVKKLRRVQVGPLKLKGLRVGEWRELTREELRALKRAAFHAKPNGNVKSRPRRRRV